MRPVSLALAAAVLSVALQSAARAAQAPRDACSAPRPKRAELMALVGAQNDLASELSRKSIVLQNGDFLRRVSAGTITASDEQVRKALDSVCEDRASAAASVAAEGKRKAEYEARMTKMREEDLARQKEVAERFQRSPVRRSVDKPAAAPEEGSAAAPAPDAASSECPGLCELLKPDTCTNYNPMISAGAMCLQALRKKTALRCSCP